MDVLRSATEAALARRRPHVRNHPLLRDMKDMPKQLRLTAVFASLTFTSILSDGWLGSQKDLSGVRVLHLGSAGKATDIDITRFGGIRTGDQSRLVGNWDPVRHITAHPFGGKDATC